MQPPVGEHPGKLIWAELVTPDLAAAERFYGGLFGWTFHDIRTDNTVYPVARLGDAPVAGLVQRAVQPDRPAQPAWLAFLSVPSVHEAGQVIVAQGGKELSAPRAYRPRGQQAMYADPQGAVFAVLNSHSGDPPDVLAAPGEWIWSAFLARDPGSTAAFYQDVFGFEVFELPSDARGEHLVLASEQFARASRRAGFARLGLREVADVVRASAPRLHHDPCHPFRPLHLVRACGGRALTAC